MPPIARYNKMLAGNGLDFVKMMCAGVMSLHGSMADISVIEIFSEQLLCANMPTSLPLPLTVTSLSASPGRITYLLDELMMCVCPCVTGARSIVSIKTCSQAFLRKCYLFRGLAHFIISEQTSILAYNLGLFCSRLI